MKDLSVLTKQFLRLPNCSFSQFRNTDLRPGGKIRESNIKTLYEIDSGSPCPTEESSIVMFNALEASLSVVTQEQNRESRGNYLPPKSTFGNSSRNNSLALANKKCSNTCKYPKGKLKVSTVFDEEFCSHTEEKLQSSLLDKNKCLKSMKSPLTATVQASRLSGKGKRYSTNYIQVKQLSDIYEPKQDEICEKPDEITNSITSGCLVSSDEGEKKDIRTILAISKGVAHRDRKELAVQKEPEFKASKVYSSHFKTSQNLSTSMESMYLSGCKSRQKKLVENLKTESYPSEKKISKIHESMEKDIISNSSISEVNSYKNLNIFKLPKKRVVKVDLKNSPKGQIKSFVNLKNEGGLKKGKTLKKKTYNRFEYYNKGKKLHHTTRKVKPRDLKNSEYCLTTPGRKSKDCSSKEKRGLIGSAQRARKSRQYNLSSLLSAKKNFRYGRNKSTGVSKGRSPFRNSRNNSKNLDYFKSENSSAKVSKFSLCRKSVPKEKSCLKSQFRSKSKRKEEYRRIYTSPKLRKQSKNCRKSTNGEVSMKPKTSFGSLYTVEASTYYKKTYNYVKSLKSIH